MKKLLSGLRNFQDNVFESQRELFKRLATGQHPEALFITCSDSRIDPNLLTQTDPGDLFVLRNAGNIVPPYLEVNGSEAATIEFAVTALGVKDIVVCGHSHCGAMKGLMHPESLKNMPAVAAWLSHAQTAKLDVVEGQEKISDEIALDRIVKQNVLSQLANLKTHPCVASRLADGTINLHGWIYEFESGSVRAYQPALGGFISLKKSESVASPADIAVTF